MKKKIRRKLYLSRETLRVMNGGELWRIRGAAQSLNPEDTDCQRDLTIPDSVCVLCGGGTLQSCDPCYTGNNTCPEHTC
jgi:hypothetical protein